MTVRCSITIDGNSELHDVPFAVVPRVGESVSIPADGTDQSYRVTRIEHLPAAAGDMVEPTVNVEVTSKLL